LRGFLSPRATVSSLLANPHRAGPV
jgi:hypothetical protein